MFILHCISRQKSNYFFYYFLVCPYFHPLEFAEVCRMFSCTSARWLYVELDWYPSWCLFGCRRNFPQHFRYNVCCLIKDLPLLAQTLTFPLLDPVEGPSSLEGFNLTTCYCECSSRHVGLGNSPIILFMILYRFKYFRGEWGQLSHGSCGQYVPETRRFWIRGRFSSNSFV